MRPATSDGKNVGMQTREQRDEKTVSIATALGLFCLAIAVGALGLWAATSFLGLRSSAASSLGWVLIIAAGGLLVGYLVRARTDEGASTRRRR